MGWLSRKLRRNTTPDDEVLAQRELLRLKEKHAASMVRYEQVLADFQRSDRAFNRGRHKGDADGNH